MSRSAIRVAVAEDMTVLWEALVTLLAMEPGIEVVAEARRGDQALAMVATLRPDIVLVDTDPPVEDRLFVARRLSEDAPGSAVVALSARASPTVVREALTNNVRGFLPKDVSVRALVDALRRVHAGEVVVDRDILASAFEMEQNPLTGREQDVLRLAAKGDTAKEVGRKLGLAVGTVSNHMTRVLRKLKARNKVDAIRLANENGWL